MRLRLTSRANQDLSHILNHLEGESRVVAKLVASRISQTLDTIKAVPLIGKLGVVEGTREFMVIKTQIMIVYRVTNDIEVLTIFHTAQHPVKKSV